MLWTGPKMIRSERHIPSKL